MDRMTAAQLRALQGQETPAERAAAGSSLRRNRPEDAMHQAIRAFLPYRLPGCVIHHSPNEVDIAGEEAARTIARARDKGTRKGWPDLEVFWRGWGLFLEVKAPGNGPTFDQKETLDALREQGFRCAVVRSIDDVEAFLAELGL